MNLRLTPVSVLILTLGLTIQGCAVKSETVYLKPNCTIPLPPELRPIIAVELYDDLVDDDNDESGKKMYDDLTWNQTKVVDWALEMEAMLDVLCDE